MLHPLARLGSNTALPPPPRLLAPSQAAPAPAPISRLPLGSLRRPLLFRLKLLLAPPLRLLVPSRGAVRSSGLLVLYMYGSSFLLSPPCTLRRGLPRGLLRRLLRVRVSSRSSGET